MNGGGGGPDSPPHEARRTVPDTVLRGVFWVLGSVVSVRRGTLVLGIIAGRVFTPSQFGAVAAGIAVVLAFAQPE